MRLSAARRDRLPTQELTRQQRVRNLRRHRQCLLQGVELLRQQSRRRNLNHNTQLGTCRLFGPLVFDGHPRSCLLRLRAASTN